MNGQFEFDMQYVVSLLRLSHLRRHPQQHTIDADCFLCGDTKGRLHIDLDKQVYRCNRCSEGGGMLDLYSAYYGVDRKEAYRQIMSSLGSGTAQARKAVRRIDAPAKAPAPAVPMAEIEVRHAAYTALLNLLSLSDFNRKSLIARGFDTMAIEKNMYRSTPRSGFPQLAQALLAQGHTLQGVPGFYQTDTGEWSIHFLTFWPGTLIPVRDREGRIQALQIRKDYAKGNKRKYYWLASGGLPNGSGTGAPAHFAGDPHAKEILITEGALKADAAHALTGKTFIALGGTPQFKGVLPYLPYIREYGVKVIEAFDMDKYKNEYVQKNLVSLWALLKENGIAMTRSRWDPAYKGIDDLALHTHGRL